MKIYDNILDYIGGTPLIRVPRISQRLGLGCNLFVKHEGVSAGGSIKDRTAKTIIEEAEKRGEIKEGATIIEPTSGNTGIGLAMISSVKGYEAIIVMPDTMSPERARLMEAYGAKVIRTDGSLGMAGAIAEAQRLMDEIPGSFMPSQFENPDNALAHIRNTGPEIFEDTDGEVDIVVGGIGTGGTISGVGEYLKSVKPGVKIIGVEPESSPILTEGRSGKHGIQGIGAGFVPKVLNLDVVDEVATVSDEDAILHARMLARLEGILVGISSGAAFSVAVKEARKEKNRGKTIVVILPDSGERYLSLSIFE